MQHTLESLARLLNGQLIGDGAVLIRDVNNIDGVKEGGLTFAEDERRLAQALATRAAAVIVPNDVKELRGRSGIPSPTPSWPLPWRWRPSDSP